MLTTAHPHLDRATGGMLNYAAKLGPRNSYRFFLLRSRRRRARGDRASCRSREPAYMHSFGLTERYLVLAEFPFVVNPISIPLSGRPYIENYRWKPELGTRFTLIDRETGEAHRPFETEPASASTTSTPMKRTTTWSSTSASSPDAQIVEDLYLERLRAGKPVAKPEMRRFRITPKSGTVTSERLVDEPIDLPRINYGRCNERPYRYTWASASAPPAGSTASSRRTSRSGLP